MKKCAKTRECSVVSETGKARWGELMTKFSEAEKDKENCKSVQMKLPLGDRSPKVLPTGSNYEGSWNILGLSGFGVYTLPHGVIYEGEFKDGEFNGEGKLLYETGESVHGKFENGEIIERKLVFNDGLEYEEENWKYCKVPDRRFSAEYDMGVQAATKSFKTFEKPCKWVPRRHYDTGEGYYDPSTKSIYKYDDLSSIIRVPSAEECKWLEANCRTKPKASLGPRPDFYEKWTLPVLELEVPPQPAAVARNVHMEYVDDDDDFDVEGFEWRPARRSTYGGSTRRKSQFSYTLQSESKHEISDKLADASNADTA